MRDIIEEHFFDYLNDCFLPSTQLRISKGCENTCTYCAIPEQEGSQVNFTPLSELKQRFLELWDQGIRHLDFVDDNFILKAEEIGAILTELGKDDRKFAFSFSAPVKLVLKNQKCLIPLRQLGLRCVNLKIINGNQDVLNRYELKMTQADQYYAIQILQALRCKIHLEYILFEPLTTLDHLHNDLIFLEKAKLLGITPYTDILTTHLDLEKDTPIGREYRSRRLYLPASDPLLPYQIMDQKAQAVFHWLAYFNQRFIKEWSELQNLLLDLRTELARQRSNWIVTNMGQELMYIIYDLRMIPYDLFKALIHCGIEDKIHIITPEEIDQQAQERFDGVGKQYWNYRKYYKI